MCDVVVPKESASVDANDVCASCGPRAISTKLSSFTRDVPAIGGPEL